MFEWFFAAKNDIGEPPYPYELLCTLDKKEYPKYLKKIYQRLTKESLNLRNPKTFGEKIQWLKLYDSTPLKSQLTDKVLVRDYVRETIGEYYLKPIFQVCKNFDEINFDKLPESFIIKANHGCKWHYLIKKKSEFLQNDVLKQIVKSHFDGWMNQQFCFWAGFEMHYKDIKPQILIEPILSEDINTKPNEIEVYCFNGEAKIFQRIQYTTPRTVSVFNENFENINLKLQPAYKLLECNADEKLRTAVNLSKQLSEGFKLARIDWLEYKDKLYFNEITFTPFSGFFEFEDKNWNLKLGKLLKLNK